MPSREFLNPEDGHSTPALCQEFWIQDLESELGVALFERSGKAIRLTDAGRAFLEGARASLARVEEAVRATRAVAAGNHGELHLGYAPTPTLEILPAVLAKFRERFPGVRVVLHDHASPEMIHGLLDGRLHAALMMQPIPQAAKGLHFVPLKTYPVGIAVASAHPLARRRSVTARELTREPFVAYSRKDYPDYHRFLARSLARSGLRPNVVEECDSGTSLAAAVESGKGLCICPSVFLSGAGSRLKFVPLEPAPPPAVVGLARRNGATSPLTEGFAAIVSIQDAPSRKSKPSDPRLPNRLGVTGR